MAGKYREFRNGSRYKGEWGEEVYMVFVDNIRKEVILSELKELFEEYGRIADVYILRKERRYVNLYFGFVRFKESY